VGYNLSGTPLPAINSNHYFNEKKHNKFMTPQRLEEIDEGSENEYNDPPNVSRVKRHFSLEQELDI
jgi:hypothetical protein